MVKKKRAVPKNKDIVVTKKAKTEVDEAENEAENLTLKYKSMTVARLKEYLRKNKQVIGGKKDELVKRCVDGEMYGALPLCMTCGQGRLKLLEDDKRVACQGYFDEDIQMRIKCSFVDAKESIERNVWRSPEDATEDSDDDGKTETKTANVLSKELSQKFQKILKEDKSKPIKEFLKAVLKFCKADDIKIKLPGDESLAKQKIGSLIMQNRVDGEIDLEGLIKAIVTDFGFESKEQPLKKKNQPRAMVPENEGIAEMLDEMAIYTAKVGGNMFKVRGLKTASIAIRFLDFEVTNGIEISKGKKKVKGIGKSTGALIEEYLTNDGEVQALIDLKKEVDGV